MRRNHVSIRNSPLTNKWDPQLPDTPVNDKETQFQEALVKAFHISDTESEKMIKLLPDGITVTITFFEAVSDAWDQFITHNHLPPILIDRKDDFLDETLDNGAGARLFCQYAHSMKRKSGWNKIESCGWEDNLSLS